MKRSFIRAHRCLVSATFLVSFLALATSGWTSGTVTNCTEANLNSALSGGGTVTFACNGSITLTSTKVISISTILNANGYDVTLNGQNGGAKTRLFYVNNGVGLTLTGLKLVNGQHTNGGAIFNNGGSLIATNCLFAFNSAVVGASPNGDSVGDGGDGGAGTNALGGAVFNSGSVFFSQCAFLTNSATGGQGGNGGNGLSTGDDAGVGGAGGAALGGAVYNAGQATFLLCGLQANQATGGNAGNGGTAVTQPGGIAGRGGRSFGGAIYNGGTLTISSSDVSGNIGVGGEGGDGGTGTSIATGIGRSGGEASGTGLYNLGTARVDGCTFALNSAQSGNAGTTPSSNGNFPGDPGAGSFGAAICNIGTNSVVNSTFYGNEVAGGNGGNGVGPSGDGGNGGHGWGGNVYGARHLTLTNCTIAFGAATGGSGGPSAFGDPGDNGVSRGGNIANSNSVFVLHNTVLSYPSVGTNGFTTGNAFVDAGYCLSSDRSVVLDGEGSRTNTNPRLGPLTDNGGPTWTMAPLGGSPCVDAGDLNVTSTLFIDQRGKPRPGGTRDDIGAYEAVPTVVAFPDRGWASEQGDVGVITISRDTVGAALTVPLSIGGNAVNGTDYDAIDNFVVIPEGATAVRILIRAVADGVTESKETVTVTIQTASYYQVNGASNATVTVSDQSMLNADKRYVRGTGTYPAFHSFVVPLDFQRGVRLADVGGNATNLFPGNPWTTNFFHFDATNPAPQLATNDRIVFRNPIVAFGTRVGGTPLLVNQVYRFGVYAGVNESTNLSQLRLKVYNKSTMAVVSTVNVFIPPESQSNAWHTFSTNGYSQMVVANGLTTFISRQSEPRWGVPQHHTYILSHKADSTATAYVYEWEAQGTADAGVMVLNNAGTGTYSKLYTVEFESRPPWQAVFVHQPHFAGKPLPPDYQGKSTEELLTVSTFLATNPAPTALGWTNLDSSPDLRQHPILDQFVSDLNRDPIALANYVFNEIELTDAFGYDDDGNVPEASVNPGGVSRSALATYQEGQGSPIEQCALLVYLLRQAGYPAAYSFPADESLKLLDSRLSSILGLQLRGAIDEFGQTYTTNRLIAVNYPWVSAYIGTNWVHLFPWMKDTEIVEGFGLYDYMPTNYNNAHKWVRDYVYGKTNILGLSGDDDTPATLFPKFVQQVLLTNAPGLSLDDIGVRVVNRRKNYFQWSDFPKPTVVGSSSVIVENLSSSTLTNLSPGLTNIFDTVSVEVYSVTNPNTKVVSGELRMADLHNRKFLARHEKITTNSHRLILSLAPYRPDTTNEITFSSVDPNDPADADVLKRLGTTNTLSATDDSLRIKFVHRRQRSLPLTFSSPNYWDVYPGFTATRVLESEVTFRKGDLAALCLNAGRVSRRMLQVHAEEIWQMEQTLGTNSAATNLISADIYQGTPAYLKGMAYYEKVDRFTDLNERLHKVRNVSSYAAGVTKLRAARNGTGQLPNGDIDLTLPTVDMVTHQVGLVGNGSVHPDSGQDPESTQNDFFVLFATDGSAQEHAIINQFLIQKEAISTVKLLRLAQQRAAGGQPGIILLTKNNHLFEGEKVYPTTGTTKLKEHDPQLWAEITNTFLAVNGSMESDYSQIYYTPWPVTNATASYSGMGALILTPHSQAGLISGILNGGAGEKVPAGSFGPANSPNQELNVNDAGDYSLATKDGTPGSPTAAPEASSQADAAGDVAKLQDGSYNANPQQTQQGQIDGYILDGQSGSYNNLADDQLDRGPQGDSDFRPGNGEAGTVADPVNTLTGEFYVDAADLTLPGPMPLQVRRNYGSHNLSPNQLGYGWKLNYMPFLTTSQGTNFYASEPDGSVLVFVPIATDLWAPSATNNPTLNNYTTSGIGSIANRFNARLARVLTNSVNTYYLTNADGSLRIFEERSFPLSAGIDRLRPYLTKWLDPRGNFYSFEYGTNSAHPDYGQVRRVLSSNGNLVGFQYDVYGRITEAYTLDGRRVTYRYDEHGDLVRVTLPDASEWQFEYQHLNWTTNSVTYRYSTHLLTKELKPDGRALQNDYDSLRRVTNQWATVGDDLRLVRNATFRYTNSFSLTNLSALLTGTTTVLDYTNRVLRYFYTNGLIRKVTDPLNQSVIQSWYEVNETNPPAYPRSLKSVTDKRGLVTTFLYDQRGNVTNTTIRGDLRGDGDTNATATTLATFTANNLPARTVNPTGTTNLFFYTNTWMLARVELWPSGATPAQAITNLIIYHDVTNATDGTVSYGLRQQEIRAAYSPDAATNEWDHDSRGFVTRALSYTGTTDPTIVVTNLHNRRGELVERTDAIGRATRLAYDALGRPTQREVFESGQGTPLAWDFSYYNPNGELVWSDGPRFDPEDYVWRDYDGNGRLTTIIRWRTQAKADGTDVEAPAGDVLYSTTFFDYDPFGNQTRVTNPRGVITTNSFDAIGQLIGRKVLDTNGTQLVSEGFDYEPGGLVTIATNALGGLTHTLYTGTGKPKFRKNADGSTNAWRYYEDGRSKREIQHNGAYWETTYNDAARTATRVFYSVGNVPLATNVTELDRRGNVVRTVDAGGFASTNRFDALDRIKIVAGPAIVSVSPTNLPSPGGPSTSIVQQVSTYLYDASGKVLTVSNALKERVVTTRDALDRVVRAEVLGSNGATVRLTATAYAANHQSVTTTNGSGSSAIVSTTYADHDGNTVLSVRYPSANVTEFDWQSFDAAGNRLASQQASRTNSQVTVWSTNGWTYDGLSRVKTATVRDGATTTFSYNAGGNVTNRAMPGGLTWRATYNTAGQRLLEYDIGVGNLASRTNNYSYYASNSLYAGLLQTRVDGRAVTCTHTYDDWLHAATNTYTGASNYHNLTIITRFDARQLATNITESFASTNTGPTVSVRRAYDAYGLLTSETIYTNNVLFSLASQGWDSAGRRDGLGYAFFGYDFTWRADGLLASATGLTGGGAYTYNDAGLLVSRTLGPKIATITSRDGMGRPLGLTTTLSGTNLLVESLGYSGDGRITTHSLTRPDFTDDRAYFYADSSRRLVEERLNLDVSKRWTNTFAYDSGTASGSGVLTKNGAPNSGSAQWTGGADGLARVTAETNNVIRRSANGRVNGVATIGASIDGQPMTVTTLINSNGGHWRASLELTPGTHQLSATAKHPSGLFTTNVGIWFTNTASAPDRVEVTYDPTGQITRRIWRSANGTTNRTQTLTWDARGRLYKVVERDHQTNGFDWTPVYDPFNRRLRTVEVPVTNNVSVTAQVLGIEQYFDPQVSYLALGVSVAGKTTWKLMGPDLNGRYGGLQGRGGFDAIIPGPELFCPTVGDARGNILAVYDVTHGSLAWNASRPTGYGATPSYRPPPLGHGANLIEATAFAGIWSDITGFYWRGYRYYDPIAGRFLSPDPLGHDGGPNLFTYANGDPINFDDPDGLIGRAVFQWMQDAGSSIGHLASDAYYSVGYIGMYPFNPDAAERYYGPSARGLAGTAVGLAQTAYDGAAYASFEMISPFDPEGAAAAYGSSLERLERFNQAFTGGEENSSAYRTTYTILNAASLAVGGEGQFGRAGRAGDFGEAVAAANRGGSFIDDWLPEFNYAGSDGPGGALSEISDTTALVRYSGPTASGWPGNKGFLTGPVATELPVGTLIDRYGPRSGTYVAPQGTPFPMRGLPEHYENQMPLETYEVVSPVKADTGLAAPAFGQPGLGKQHQLPFSVQELIDLGVLKPK